MDWHICVLTPIHRLIHIYICMGSHTSTQTYIHMYGIPYIDSYIYTYVWDPYNICYTYVLCADALNTYMLTPSFSTNVLCANALNTIYCIGLIHCLWKKRVSAQYNVLTQYNILYWGRQHTTHLWNKRASAHNTYVYMYWLNTIHMLYKCIFIWIYIDFTCQNIYIPEHIWICIFHVSSATLVVGVCI